MGGALDLWLYNTVIVDTFFNAPGQLAAGIIGAYDSVGIVDQIIFSGGDAASLLIQKGGIFNGDFSYYIAGFAVYSIVGLTAIYAMFCSRSPRSRSRFCLRLGPLFIALLFFETTKRFFESWIAQLANYAFVTILTVLVAALMMGIVSSAAQQAADAGGGIPIARCRAGVHGGGTHVSRHAPGHADGGRACERAGAELLWPGERGAGVGIRARARAVPGSSGAALIDRETTRWDPLEPQGGVLPARGDGCGPGAHARRRPAEHHTAIR